jgi:ATP-dependent DNA ligase
MPLAFRPINNPRRVSHEYLLRMAREEVPGSWLAQPKYDGWRCQGYKSGGQWSFYSKSGEPSLKLPPQDLLGELAGLFAGQDGVALDMEWMGPRCKDELRARYGHGGYNGFRVFDLLYLNGLWLGDDPFSQRYANLKTIMELSKAKFEAPRIELAPAVDRGWDELFEECKRDDLTEGIVLRRAASKLVCREDNPFWLKVKWRSIHEKAQF